MVLPTEFQSFGQYFEGVTKFLDEVSWIHQFAVTQILTYDVLKSIPDDWLEPLLQLSIEELNDVPTGLIKNNWPSSLIKFLQNCQRFTLPVLSSKSKNGDQLYDDQWICEAPREIWRGMSQKKMEEVKTMSAFVHHECQRLNIRRIVDLGSGLGYIDRLLLLQGYKILGIESQPKLVTFSTQQKENFFPKNIGDNLSYCNLRISQDSVSKIRDTIKGVFDKPSLEKISSHLSNVGNKKLNNKFDWERISTLCQDQMNDNDSQKVCMIGLHVCGDLAVTGMKLYLDLAQVSALILVPCCYHKMALRDSNRGQLQAEFALEDALCDTDSDGCEQAFDNFPLSQTLNRVSQSQGSKFVSRPFLRLANQGSSSSWEGWTEVDHQTHSFSVLARAVIELFAHSEGASFKKCFRRVVRKTSLKGKEFASYATETLSRCQFVGENNESCKNNSEVMCNKLLNLWEEHKDKVKAVEVLTALQMCLEPVAESLVVADRLCSLYEQGVENINVVRMMDSKLSPRCLAYIASKS